MMHSLEDARRERDAAALRLQYEKNAWRREMHKLALEYWRQQCYRLMRAERCAKFPR